MKKKTEHSVFPSLYTVYNLIYIYLCILLIYLNILLCYIKWILSYFPIFVHDVVNLHSTHKYNTFYRT